MWAVGRRVGVTFDRSKTTAIVAAGALAAHAGQHLACAVPHSDAHLLIFHFGGVLLAILLAALGHAALRRRPSPPVEPLQPRTARRLRSDFLSRS